MSMDFYLCETDIFRWYEGKVNEVLKIKDTNERLNKLFELRCEAVNEVLKNRTDVKELSEAYNESDFILFDSDKKKLLDIIDSHTAGIQSSKDKGSLTSSANSTGVKRAESLDTSEIFSDI